jgi:hypothetical protein
MEDFNYESLKAFWNDFNKSNIFNTHIAKNDTNELGFTIKKLSHGFSCINEILNESARQMLSIGDIIIRLNDVPTNTMSHSEIVSLIKQSPTIVRLDVYRPGMKQIESSDVGQSNLLSKSKFDTSDECNDTTAADIDDQDRTIDELVSVVYAFNCLFRCVVMKLRLTS